MKLKTVSALVLTASSAFALIGPSKMDTKTMCLETRENKDGTLFAVPCDATRNNKIQKAKILANGCAEDQASIVASKPEGAKEFNVKMPVCAPPNLAQL